MNPFNKLKVERDEEDFVEVNNGKIGGSSQPLFGKDQKPKKKIRPEKKEDEQREEVNDNDGFAMVGKGNKKPNNRGGDDDKNFEQKPGKKDAPRKFHQNRNNQQFREGAKTRQFDRHVSGTGRGKEIAKGGRGGKGTWEGKGREMVDYDTDYYFNRVLNKQNDAEEVVVEEPVKEAEPEKKEEVVAQENAEENQENKEEGEKKERKKGKKDLPEEEDEKNKLIIPENAMTLEDYKNKVKKITTDTSKVAGTKVQVDLEAIERNEENDVIAVTVDKQKKDKKKVKTLDAKEVELNKLVGANLKIEDNSQNRERDYNNRGNYNNKNNYNNNNKNNYKKNNKKVDLGDLPELK